MSGASRPRSRARGCTAAVPAAVILAWLFLAVTAAAGGPGPGDSAPGFALEDWNGRPVALADLRGRVVVVDFWASWCVPCREALPRLDALARRHPASALSVLAVSIDRERAGAERFLAEHLPERSLTVLHDPEGGVLARYGASGLPAIYVVDESGVLRHEASGYEPAHLEEIETLVDSLLADCGR